MYRVFVRGVEMAISREDIISVLERVAREAVASSLTGEWGVAGDALDTYFAMLNEDIGIPSAVELESRFVAEGMQPSGAALLAPWLVNQMNDFIGKVAELSGEGEQAIQDILGMGNRLAREMGYDITKTAQSELMPADTVRVMQGLASQGEALVVTTGVKHIIVTFDETDREAFDREVWPDVLRYAGMTGEYTIEDFFGEIVYTYEPVMRGISEDSAYEVLGEIGTLTIEVVPVPESFALYEGKTAQTFADNVRVEMTPEPDHDLAGWYYGKVYLQEGEVAQFSINAAGDTIHPLGGSDLLLYTQAIWDEYSKVTGKTAQAEGLYVYEVMDRLGQGAQSIPAVVYVTEVIYLDKQRTPYPCTIVSVGADGLDVVLTDHGTMFFGKDNMDVSFVLSGVKGSKTAQDETGPKYCSKCGTQKVVSNVTGKLGCPKCGKEKNKTAQTDTPVQSGGFCEQCGKANPWTIDGYTTCCNEPATDFPGGSDDSSTENKWGWADYFGKPLQVGDNVTVRSVLVGRRELGAPEQFVITMFQPNSVYGKRVGTDSPYEDCIMERGMMSRVTKWGGKTAQAGEARQVESPSSEDYSWVVEYTIPNGNEVKAYGKNKEAAEARAREVIDMLSKKAD
jgi:uncharacterized Zn ribbon protein